VRQLAAVAIALVMAISARAAPPPPSPESPVAGVAIAELSNLYPMACGSPIDLIVHCVVNEPTPQQLCPTIGPCRKLSLDAFNGVVIGYSAQFSGADWSRSLRAERKTRGEPRLEKIPGEMNWQWMDGPASFLLLYTVRQSAAAMTYDVIYMDAPGLCLANPEGCSPRR
jgi:hypothetical protein